MHVIVMGAGVIGVSTAWHLLQRGHRVTLVDRQADAALETSFGNAAQISVSYCEPWANREAPLKALKWLFDPEGPLKFRPQLDPAQWRWGSRCSGEATSGKRRRSTSGMASSSSANRTSTRSTVVCGGSGSGEVCMSGVRGCRNDDARAGRGRQREVPMGGVEPPT